MLLIPIVLFLVYLYFFYNLKQKPETTNRNERLKISVLVAAKNEESNLQLLIDSLQNQNYSKDNYEVILIDDNSTDSTYNCALKLTHSFSNWSIIKADNKKYKGKRGVLQIGIEASKFDYLLITDADCQADPDFIKSFSNKFSENFDFIFGVAPFIQNNSFINNIACFDNLWVHILTFSFANIGLPYSAAARSFGFNKESFYKIEGFKNTTKTISGDDDLLLGEAVKNKLRIGTIINHRAFVYTKPKETLSGFIKQKSRHTSTSNYYSAKVKLVLGLWHVLNICMLLSVFLIYFDISFGYFFLAKIIGDVFIVKYIMMTFSYNFKFSEIILLQIIYEGLLVVNYIRGSLVRDQWK
jgi:cellulose synthase/poly-beta-1,6-N-acetylglucosamine synthase-like glycosyltransferase